MATYTNEVTTNCGRRAVILVDFWDTARRLLLEPIPLSETLEDCGCGDSECGQIEAAINKYREVAGKGPVDPGITPATTIQEVIDHAC